MCRKYDMTMVIDCIQMLMWDTRFHVCVLNSVTREILSIYYKNAVDSKRRGTGIPRGNIVLHFLFFFWYRSLVTVFDAAGMSF